QRSASPACVASALAVVPLVGAGVLVGDLAVHGLPRCAAAIGVAMIVGCHVEPYIAIAGLIAVHTIGDRILAALRDLLIDRLIGVNAHGAPISRPHCLGARGLVALAVVARPRPFVAKFLRRQAPGLPAIIDDVASAPGAVLVEVGDAAP